MAPCSGRELSPLNDASGLQFCCLTIDRRSSLSHDFYQVMVGKADMGLAGWKQLVLWSLEHSCMDDAEKASAAESWEAAWEEFLHWVVKTYDQPVKV